MTAESSDAFVKLSRAASGKISFEARNSTLGEIILKFHDTYRIEIKGLEYKESEIILEYDGVPINSARQLVSEVEKKSQASQVEMVFVRQKFPTRVILNGGFIGVRVLTRKIAREEFNAYH